MLKLSKIQVKSSLFIYRFIVVSAIYNTQWNNVPRGPTQITIKTEHHRLHKCGQDRNTQEKRNQETVRECKKNKNTNTTSRQSVRIGSNKGSFVHHGGTEEYSSVRISEFSIIFTYPDPLDISLSSFYCETLIADLLGVILLSSKVKQTFRRKEDPTVAWQSKWDKTSLPLTAFLKLG